MIVSSWRVSDESWYMLCGFSLSASLFLNILTTSVKGLLQEIIPTIPEATTWTHHNRRHQNYSPIDSIFLQMFTYKESGPERAGLPDAGRGGEGHTGEREGQNHGP